MARLEGIEPPTDGLEIRCSIRLSYRRVGRWCGRGTLRPGGSPDVGYLTDGSGYTTVKESRATAFAVARVVGVDDGARTRDNRSHSPVLCQLSYTHHDLIFELVGARGFEPPAPWSQTRCATRLRYAPSACFMVKWRLETIPAGDRSRQPFWLSVPRDQRGGPLHRPAADAPDKKTGCRGAFPPHPVRLRATMSLVGLLGNDQLLRRYEVVGRHAVEVHPAWNRAAFL